MSEEYQRAIVVAAIAVAAGPETASAVHAALDSLEAQVPPDTLAVARVTPAPHPESSAQVELERLQRDLALGAVAARWRHTLNNSLAALLAEAQLLSMEPLASEHVQTVERIIALCRRMVVTLREGPPVEPLD